MKPWDGPGRALQFLKGLNDESFDDAVRQGLTPDLVIEARAEADNSIVVKSTIMAIAAKFDSLEAIKFLENKGYSIFQVDEVLTFLFLGVFFIYLL